MEKTKITLYVLILLFFSTTILTQSIKIAHPHTGQSVTKGSSLKISWQKFGKMHNMVKLRLYNPAGHTKILNISNGTPNDGNFSWPIPHSVPDGSYRVRVKTLDNKVFSDSGVFSIKGNFFTIIPAFEISAFVILNPLKGATWFKGNSYYIKWKKQIPMGNFVKILLYPQGQPHLADAGQGITITSKTLNNGSFLWHIPTHNRTGHFALRLETLDKKNKGDSNPFYVSDLVKTNTVVHKAPPLLPPEKATFSITNIKSNFISKGKLGKISVKIKYSSQTNFAFTRYKGNPLYGPVYLDCKIYDAKYPMDKTYPWKVDTKGPVYAHLQYQQRFAIKTGGNNHLDYSPKILADGSGYFELHFKPVYPGMVQGLQTNVKMQTGPFSAGAFCSKYYFPKLHVQVYIHTKEGIKVFSKQVYLIYDRNKYPLFQLVLPGKVNICSQGIVYW